MGDTSQVFTHGYLLVSHTSGEIACNHTIPIFQCRDSEYISLNIYYINLKQKMVILSCAIKTKKISWHTDRAFFILLEPVDLLIYYVSLRKKMIGKSQIYI